MEKTEIEKDVCFIFSIVFQLTINADAMCMFFLVYSLTHTVHCVPLLGTDVIVMTNPAWDIDLFRLLFGLQLTTLTSFVKQALLLTHGIVDRIELTVEEISWVTIWAKSSLTQNSSAYVATYFMLTSSGILISETNKGISGKYFQKKIVIYLNWTVSWQKDVVYQRPVYWSPILSNSESLNHINRGPTYRKCQE